MIVQQMSMEHWYNDNEKEKLRYLEKNLSQCHFFHKKIPRGMTQNQTQVSLETNDLSNGTGTSKWNMALKICKR
jgi:hypothetical protein